MLELTGLLIGLGPVLAVLAWCNARDRRHDAADRVRARIDAALTRVLGGESLIAVRVEAASGWRAGRVYLSAPSEFQLEVANVSGAVLHELPHDYDLVVHAACTIGR